MSRKKLRRYGRRLTTTNRHCFVAESCIPSLRAKPRESSCPQLRRVRGHTWLETEFSTGTGAGTPVGDRVWDTQFDLCTQPWSAPDGQVRADPRGALVNSNQTVMAEAAFLRTLCVPRIDSLAIVADAHTQAVAVANFRFNSSGSGMLERISDRLARNSIDFVTNNGVQLARPSFHNDP